MSVVSDWDNDYSRIARAAAQLRAAQYNNNNQSLSQQAITKETLHSGLDRLNTRLRNLEQSRSLEVSELGRRRNLVQHLSKQIDYRPASNYNSNNNMSQSTNPQGQSSTMMAMRQQDEMLDELAVGVGRLLDQTQLIGDEAKMHVHLIDQVEKDVEMANDGMESETRRAMQLQQDKSVWRLYMVIAGLSVLLFILVLSGL